MGTADGETRVSAAPRGVELVAFAIASALLVAALLPFPEVLLLFAVAGGIATIMAAALGALEDRATGATARFALAIAVLGLTLAAFAGIVAGGASTRISSEAGGLPGKVVETLLAAMFMGGIPALIAGAAVGVFFARVRAAGRRRLRWVALEATVFSTLGYLVVALLYALANRVL